MVIAGLCQFGLANAAYGHQFSERFPMESIPGVKQEWNRLLGKCYDLLTGDIGNKDLYDIYNSMQKQTKSCKTIVSSGTSMSIEEVENCHRSIELGYMQCKEAASTPETVGELKSEVLLNKIT